VGKKQQQNKTKTKQKQNKQTNKQINKQAKSYKLQQTKGSKYICNETSKKLSPVARR
jgi:hypothetical protein